jgi:hypothetical protein
LEAWRNRPLGEVKYLILDARYEKMRHGGVVRDGAVLSAIGIGPDAVLDTNDCQADLTWVVSNPFTPELSGLRKHQADAGGILGKPGFRGRRRCARWSGFRSRSSATRW